MRLRQLRPDDLRGPAATGLLLLAILTFLAVAPGHGAAPLAAVGVGAVLFRGLFALGPMRRALQDFAEPLDLLLGCALVLMTMALTGAIRSVFAVLLFVDLLLVRALLGAAASRFLSLITLLGLGALAGAAGPLAASEGGLLALAARVLWPLPVLLAMEVTAPRPPATGEDARARAPVPVARAPAEPVERPRETTPVHPPARTGGSADAWGAVVHDLKSPLSVIRVYADLIAEQAARGEPARPDHLRNLADEIDLMDTLLAGAAPPRSAPPAGGRAGPARADLVRLLGGLAESYRLTHADRLRIEFVAERPEVAVAADPVSLQRVFRNLLDNAVKFTPPGGRVRVRVGADESHGLVTVSDTGVGMTAEERARAFEYSFRGQAARGVEGRGLGLGVSRELVEQSGGTIALSSEQGQGSDVTVRLPLGQGADR
jgi:signal transduction histidine kinase